MGGVERLARARLGERLGVDDEAGRAPARVGFQAQVPVARAHLRLTHNRAPVVDEALAVVAVVAKVLQP